MLPQCRVAGCLSPAQPLRRGTAVELTGLCRVCKMIARARVCDGTSLADVVAALVDDGLRARVLVCGWCSRETGRGGLQRAGDGGWECRPGEGCAARKLRAS